MSGVTPSMRQNDWKQDSKYFVGALLIHALVGLVLVGLNWRNNQVVPQLAINAVLVDRNTLNQLARQAAPPAPPVEAEPAPAPVEDKQQELEKQRVQHEREQEQLKQQQKQQELELQQTQEKERQRLAVEAEQKKQQELQRQAAEAEQKKQQQEAEKKRLADIQQKQREVELKRQADAEAKAQKDRETELNAQLAAEEGRNSAVNSGAQARYAELIKQQVMRKWIKPPTAKMGLECDVSVTQAVGGTVLSAQVVSCNGDGAVRQSIENAVLSASPLPQPDDPRVFMRTFILKFKPTE